MNVVGYEPPLLDDLTPVGKSDSSQTRVLDSKVMKTSATKTDVMEARAMDESVAKVLIVDDVQENLIALEAVLKGDGITTYIADSSRKALDLLLDHEFAVAIVDVQMPEMNGFELAELMRSTERTRKIPIIFITAASQEADYAFRGYEKGAVDFLYKPIDSHTVKSKVKVFIDMYFQSLALNEKIAALEKIQTEQEQLLSQLQDTQQKLEYAIRTRDDFISIISHELRTPLNAFRLDFYTRRHYLENGKMEEFTAEKIKRMIDFDERQLDRLLRLINDTLDISRIRTGQLSVRPTRINLAELVEKVVSQLSPQLQAARCDVEFMPANPIVGFLDEFRIEQALINLLLNAMRHGAGKPIEITVEETGCGARLSVRDNGVGVLADHQERIFQQFERAGDGKRSSGLGLGLFITDQIVKAHDGRIYICSHPGEGATFSIVLPLKSAGLPVS